MSPLMLRTLKGANPGRSSGFTNAPGPRSTGAKELSNTSMPPALAAYSRVCAPLIAKPVYTAPGVVTWIKAVGPVSQAEMVPFRLANMKCAGLPSPPFFTGQDVVLVLLAWPVGACGPVAVVGIKTSPAGGFMFTFVTVVLLVTS